MIWPLTTHLLLPHPPTPSPPSPLLSHLSLALALLQSLSLLSLFLHTDQAETKRRAWARERMLPSALSRTCVCVRAYEKKECVFVCGCVRERVFVCACKSRTDVSRRLCYKTKKGRLCYKTKKVKTPTRPYMFARAHTHAHTRTHTQTHTHTHLHTSHIAGAIFSYVQPFSAIKIHLCVCLCLCVFLCACVSKDLDIGEVGPGRQRESERRVAKKNLNKKKTLTSRRRPWAAARKRMPCF